MKETSKAFVKKAVEGKKSADARVAKAEEELARSEEVAKQLESRIAEIQGQLAHGAGGNKLFASTHKTLLSSCIPGIL